MTVMGWQKARDAAWRSFGQRYWKWIVGLDMARRAAPAVLAGLGLAAIVAGVWWLIRHARMPDIDLPAVRLPWLAGWAWAALALVALVCVGWLVAWARQPYRIPAAYRPGTWRRRILAVFALAGLTVTAIVAGDR